MVNDHEWDDEDSFRSDVLGAAIEADTVNYQVDPVTDYHSFVIVELFTGDRFKVSIEQVREDPQDDDEEAPEEEEDG